MSSIFNITSSLPSYPVVSWSQQSNARVSTPGIDLQETGFSGSQPVGFGYVNFIQKANLQRANFFSGSFVEIQQKAIEPISSSLEVVKTELEKHVHNIDAGPTRFRGHCVGTWIKEGENGIWTSRIQPGTHSPGECDGNLTFAQTPPNRFFIPYQGRERSIPGNVINQTSITTGPIYQSAFNIPGGFVADTVVQVNFLYPMNPLHYLVDLSPVWASTTASNSTVETAGNVNYQKVDMWFYVGRKDPSFFHVRCVDRNQNAVPIARIPNWNINCSVWVRSIDPIPRGNPAGVPNNTPKPPPDERFLF